MRSGLLALAALLAALTGTAAQAQTCRALCPDGSESEVIDCDNPDDIPMCLRRHDAPAGSAGAAGNNGNNGNLRDESSRAIGEGIVHGDAGLVSMGILGTMISNQLDGSAQAARQAQAAADAQGRAAAASAGAAQQQMIQQEEARRLDAARQSDDERARQRQDLVAQMQAAPASAAAAPHTAAYGNGYRDAAGCVSQNAGPACAALSGNEWQTCLDDYRAGYAVGMNLQQQLMTEAAAAGQRAGASGQPSNAAGDLQPAGGCATGVTEAYNRAWFQARHAAP